MLKRAAELSVRLADWVGARVKDPGKSQPALLAYRVAGFLVGAFGGRLESRIISFAAPYSDNCSRLERTISELEGHLKSMNIIVNVRETSLSGAEAMMNPDTRDMCRDGADGIHFYEVFVPTYHYWRASEATERFMNEPARTATEEA
jgi:hypothetical protein